jgi:uncharacterized membrane protein YdjX (TVP38/TMEM64 family)
MSCDDFLRADISLAVGLIWGLFIAGIMPILDAVATKISQFIVGRKDV